MQVTTFTIAGPAPASCTLSFKATVETVREFSPEILPQDVFRARWKREGRINSQGLCTNVPQHLPPMQAEEKRFVAAWISQIDFKIESSRQDLYWITPMNLDQAIAFVVDSTAFPIEEIALIGSVVQKLTRKHATDGMRSYGFLTEAEEMDEHTCYDTDVRFQLSGDIIKSDFKKCLKQQMDFLAGALPDKLKSNDSDNLQLIRNTGFQKWHVQEDEEQLFMTAAFGSPPIEFIIVRKLKSPSLFRMDDQQLGIRRLYKPFNNVEGIYLNSSKGSTQAAADLKMKRARFTNLEKCDARAYFRYFIAQIKGILIDEPKEAENHLYDQIKVLTEEKAACLLYNGAKNHLPAEGLSFLLLMLNSLACAEKKGCSWNFQTVAKKVHELANLSRESLGPEGQVIYDAIYKEEIPFSQIEAALQISAFFYLFTGAEKKWVKAFLTESSFEPAMQWQFGNSHTYVVPLKIRTIPSDPRLKPLYEAFLPKAYCYDESRQVFPYLECLQLPDLFDLSQSFAEPLLAIQCLLLHPRLDLPRVLDLFLAAGRNERLIAPLEECLSRRQIYPKWDLRKEEEWVLTLAKSGVVEICRIAFAKWKMNPSVSLGIALFDAFLKADLGLALRIRAELTSMPGFTAEGRTFTDACAIAKHKDPQGIHHQDLIAQAIPIVRAWPNGEKVNKSLLELLSCDDSSPLYFALLEKELLPKECAPISQREFLKAHERGDLERASQILTWAKEQKVKLQTPQDCALLEQMIVDASAKNNDAAVLKHIQEVAKLQKLSDKAREALRKVAAKKKEAVFELARSTTPNLHIEAFHLWKKHYATDLALAEEIYHTLPYEEEDALVDLSLAILAGSKKKIPEDMIVLLEKRMKELLPAMLRSACQINKEPLRKAVHTAVKAHLEAGEMDEAIALWRMAKGQQIGAFKYFQEMPAPKSPFFRRLLQANLLSPSEASQGVNILIQGKETDDIAAILEDLSKIALKEYPQELSNLLETDCEGLAKGVLALPCALPSALSAPFTRLIESFVQKGDLDQAGIYYDLCAAKGLKITCREILRKKTEQAIEAKNKAVIPLLQELLELDLLEKAHQEGLLEAPVEGSALLALSLQNGSPGLILTLLKKVKKCEESLKPQIQSFCEREAFSLPALELFSCLKSLGIPLRLPVSDQWLPLVATLPDLVPFLPLAQAFPYLSLPERTRLLLQDESFANYAPQVARELKGSPEALQILVKYQVQEPLLWIEALAKCAEPLYCWKMIGEQEKLLSQEMDKFNLLQKQVLLSLGKTKDPLIAKLLTNKDELERQVPEKVLIQVLPALFLGCPEGDELINARMNWHPYFSKFERIALLNVDLKMHLLLSARNHLDLEGEIEALEQFCLKAEILQVKESMSLALAKVFEKCKKPTDSLFNLCRQILNLGLIDPFLVVSHLSAGLEDKYFELSLSYIQIGLDKLNGEPPVMTKRSCELIFLNCAGSDEKKVLIQLFRVLNHAKAPSLFSSKFGFDGFYLDVIVKGLKAMNTAAAYDADYLTQMANRLKSITEIYRDHQSSFMQLVKQLDTAIVGLLFHTKAEESLAKDLDAKYRTNMLKAYEKNREQDHVVKFMVMLRHVNMLKEFTAAYSRAEQNREVMDRLLDATVANMESCHWSLFNTFPIEMEEILYQFCLACAATKDKIWMKTASAIMISQKYYERFENKDYAAKILTLFKK